MLSLFCGNGVVTASAAESTEAYTLQDSTYYDNPSWRTWNNCYAYAIGRTIADEQKAQSFTNGIYCQPGDFSNNEISAETTLLQLTEYVSADLQALLCYNIVISTTCPTLSTLQNNQQLICLRKGGSDYHFMRYNSSDGYWYHKPGDASDILRYNYQPSNDRVWTNEYSMAEYAIEGTTTYDSNIYYISYYAFYNTVEERYDVSTYDQLKQIASRPQDTWFLLNNITIPSADPWTPIESFTGTFNGNEKMISGFVYEGAAQSKIGFVKDNYGTIENLIIRDAEIRITGAVNLNQTIDIGVIAACNYATITNCDVGYMNVYAEANISSNTMANVGAISGRTSTTVGMDSAEITLCNVQFFNASVCGNLGGIVGIHDGFEISDCTVASSGLNIYHGTVGGIVGLNQSYVESCDVSNTDISCYNGYPDILPEYYPTTHYGREGGIAGENCTAEAYITGCSVNYTDIMCNSDYVDAAYGGATFAPEMGVICGRKGSNTFAMGNVFSNNTVVGYNLQIIGTWDQSQYIGNRAIGRTV